MEFVLRYQIWFEHNSIPCLHARNTLQQKFAYEGGVAVRYQSSVNDANEYRLLKTPPIIFRKYRNRSYHGNKMQFVELPLE
jgi:hypothetical protein